MDKADAASVALINGARILLIERALAPFKGDWTLPGGRREPGESIEACATREIGEELGLAVFDLRPVLTMTVGAAGRFRLAVFATTRFAGDIVASDEIAAHRWVEAGAIAMLRTTPDLAMVIERAFAIFGPDQG